MPAVTAYSIIEVGTRGEAGVLPTQGAMLLGVGAVVGEGGRERGVWGGRVCGGHVVYGFGDGTLADELDQWGALRCLENFGSVHGRR